MIRTGYSEKEIAIFNGLMDLIKQGCNPYSIKVSDIAKASHVGKGTIYDYFESKEGVISKAILFNISKEMETSINRIKLRESFQDKFYEILNIIEENMENNLSIYNTLFTSRGMDEFYEYLIDEKDYLKQCMLTIETMIDYMLDIGYKEGIIKTSENRYYQRMALRSSIGSFSLYLSHRNIYKDISIDEAKEVAYKLLIKALS